MGLRAVFCLVSTPDKKRPSSGNGKRQEFLTNFYYVSAISLLKLGMVDPGFRSRAPPAIHSYRIWNRVRCIEAKSVAPMTMAESAVTSCFQRCLIVFFPMISDLKSGDSS